MYKNDVSQLRKYVKIKVNKDTDSLKKKSLEWLKVSTQNQLSYEIDWLGIPVIQTPEDLILMQELIFKIKPDYIIETGIAHGGSLIYYASLLELLGKGKVIGVDIEIREHNRKAIKSHPMYKRITMIKGDSISDRTIQKIKKLVLPNSKIIVCLDSDHTKTHVLRELELYKEFVIPGCYIVVFDTCSSGMAKLGVFDSTWIDNGPKEAIDEFLNKNDNFEIDKNYNKLYISYSQDGYLKRTK